MGEQLLGGAVGISWPRGASTTLRRVDAHAHAARREDPRPRDARRQLPRGAPAPRQPARWKLARIARPAPLGQAQASASKYAVGTKGKLEVIAHAVHNWWRAGAAATVEHNDAIQRAIWRHLRGGGSVAVHCLAGIHRAACIVACHFLYRHYTLGHAEVPADAADIYAKLISVRRDATQGLPGPRPNRA